MRNGRGNAAGNEFSFSMMTVSSSAWKKSLLLTALTIAGRTLAFKLHHHVAILPRHSKGNDNRYHRRCITINSTTEEETSTKTIIPQQQRRGSPSSSGSCYYKRIDGSWKPRKELNRLVVGERLFAIRLLERDLLNGKTGPKAFVECGIGRRNSKGKWNIVNGMIRLGKKGMKISLARKKASKIPTDTLVEVYVSKVNLDEMTLEVCLSREEALHRSSSGRSKIPASNLRVGEILTGTVKNVTPYGVFVDVNANRNGLLHISKVAAKQNAFVAQEEGLKKLGLVKGSPVFVMVVSNDGKRLEFDLAPDIADSDEYYDDDDDEDDDDDDDNNDDNDDNPFRGMTSFKLFSTSWVERSVPEDINSDIGDDEAAMWAAYAAADTSTNNDDEEEDDDEYDEDADIEDALGIGSW